MGMIAQSSHEANGIIIGMVLGDSYIRMPKDCINPLLSTYHAERSSDYLSWKRDLLQGYLGGTIKTTRDAATVYWVTPVARRLKEFRKDFYPRGVKIVKDSILNRMTPASLAIWYMDDGCLRWTKHRFDGIQLATNGFDVQSLAVILRWFSERLGLTFTLQKNGAIHTDSASGLRFLSIVKPYVDQVESMRYKVDLNRFNLSSCRAMAFLPPALKARLDGDDKSTPLRGYVWQAFPVSALWPNVSCLHCGAEIIRKISSLYCSQRCGQIYRRHMVKDIVRHLEQSRNTD